MRLISGFRSSLQSLENRPTKARSLAWHQTFYLSKPVRLAELRLALEQALGAQ